MLNQRRVIYYKTFYSRNHDFLFDKNKLACLSISYISTVFVTSNLNLKCGTRAEDFKFDQRNSLLHTIVNYRCRKIYSTGFKTFSLHKFFKLNLKFETLKFE